MADKGKRRGSVDRFDVAELEDEVRTLKPVREPVREEVAEPVEPAVALVEEEARYFVDPQWYEQRGLSFSTVAQGRFCSSCAAKLGTSVEERYPVVDSKTKRVTFELRRVPYGVNPIPIIRDCCSRSREYITQETPLLEAIFRVFLANGNQPMPLSTVREHLLTYLPEMAALRSDFPASVLERLIRGDHSYGIQEHKLPAGV